MESEKWMTRLTAIMLLCAAGWGASAQCLISPMTVSYTHLDVYKRQALDTIETIENEMRVHLCLKCGHFQLL